MRKNAKITDEIAPLIKELWEKGVPSRDIQKQFGLKPATISQFVRRKGIARPFNISARTNLIALDNGLFQCSKCEKPKTAAEYQINRCGNLIGYCRDCRTKEELDRVHTNPDSWINRKLIQYKHRAMKDGVPYALDDEYVKWLYKQQNGKCFYSDIAIIWGHAEQNKQLSLSIDKVIPSKGYVKGNVVLAQTRINSAKSDFSLEEMKLWMPEWYRRIVTSEWLDAKSYGVYHTV